MLSPILFNIFIMDMFDDVQGSVTKFADDGTVWHTGKNIPELAEKVTTDVKKIQHNCNKWRQTEDKFGQNRGDTISSRGKR